MSAFICEEKTFKEIYSGMKIFKNDAYIKYDIEKFLGGRQIEELIDILFRLNVRAVNQRYREDTPEATTKERLKGMCRIDINVNVYQFLKSLECLHYQMAEGEVPATKEYQMLEELIKDVCVSLVHRSAEYERANWG